jgi:hypothetical protein
MFSSLNKKCLNKHFHAKCLWKCMKENFENYYKIHSRVLVGDIKDHDCVIWHNESFQSPGKNENYAFLDSN